VTNFRTTDHGLRIFVPWAPLRRDAYLVPTEEKFLSLQERTRAYAVIMAAVAAAAVLWQGARAGGVTLLIALAFYAAWAGFQCRELERADEPSLRQSSPVPERPTRTAEFWLLEIVCLAFVAAGAVALLLDPSTWMVSLASIGFFGLCAVVLARRYLAGRRAV
jgi:hypothetical protein